MFGYRYPERWFRIQKRMEEPHDQVSMYRRREALRRHGIDRANSDYEEYERLVQHEQVEVEAEAAECFPVGTFLCHGVPYEVLLHLREGDRPPHVHVSTPWTPRGHEVCVRLDAADYYFHGAHRARLDEDEVLGFANLMESDASVAFAELPATHWWSAVCDWNHYADMRGKPRLDVENSACPDYRELTARSAGDGSAQLLRGRPFGRWDLCVLHHNYRLVPLIANDELREKVQWRSILVEELDAIQGLDDAVKETIERAGTGKRHVYVPWYRKKQGCRKGPQGSRTCTPKGHFRDFHLTGFKPNHR